MIKKYIYNRFCAHRPVAHGEEFRINDVVRSHNRKIITIPFIKRKYIGSSKRYATIKL